MSFLTIEDVTYSYRGKNPVLHNVNWGMNKGEFHCLIGKSGCGKTTLLKLAAGLLQTDKGRIHLEGSEVVKPSPDCGFVFQSPTLLEWKTVMDNVLLPISLKRKLTEEDRTQALELLELVGLASFSDRYPLQLSGGQQSRAAIVRALVQRPSLLFMDEPFAALDAITRDELQDDLLRMCRRYNMTVLFITHDISEAVYLADAVGVMAEGEMVYQSKVELERPRRMEMRYDSYFNELCYRLRQVMGGNQS
ncbi:ABC transporter ATP-binding protein [Mesobacillus maritimus]|uniref:ABC transporter ATP-binding protein n=1 Tax=Mesobacillus maritimus TaxID=1643336 RepID=UPI00203EC1B2|nr:ABC transporter ATP-binding protein [Mesobacillus maritimus]MCM3587786.1 ABC transporter ATP-binding protein [Mesobacillus maritimus]